MGAARPRLLDLFCGAGGVAMGYYRAGFDVVGVDHVHQPRYPFAFVQADALEYLEARGREYDVIHASPPCQRYAQVNRRAHLAGRSYPDLIPATRDGLARVVRVWVIENVEAAPLRNAVRLCGSSFGLAVRRHRLFEAPLPLFAPPCAHRWQRLAPARYPTCFQTRGGPRRTSCVVQAYGNTPGVAHWPAALGINWMTRAEMTQAIPPAYTEFIGRQLLAALGKGG
jgi:DNA (cytosine-5)-methyltransferase 1